jgi:hypothetical protein
VETTSRNLDTRVGKGGGISQVSGAEYVCEEEVKEKVGVGSEHNNWYGGIPSLTMLGIEIRQQAYGLLNGSFTVRSHI